MCATRRPAWILEGERLANGFFVFGSSLPKEAACLDGTTFNENARYDGIGFEWHGPKAMGNRRKHGVTFEERATIFGDERAILLDDPKNYGGEVRWILFGRSGTGKLLAVVHVERGERIRIISVRPMTNGERRDFE